MGSVSFGLTRNIDRSAYEPWSTHLYKGILEGACRILIKRLLDYIRSFAHVSYGDRRKTSSLNLSERSSTCPYAKRLLLFAPSIRE